MSLDVWEARQQVVTILQGTAAVTAQLASGAASIFDSRAPDEEWEPGELPAIVVDTPQETWQQRSVHVPDYVASTNFVIEVAVGDSSLSSAEIAELRDKIVEEAVKAVLGNAALWDRYEQAGQVQISRAMSTKELRRGGAQIIFDLKQPVSIDFIYTTETALDGFDVTIDMLDPEQGADVTPITAEWDV